MVDAHEEMKGLVDDKIDNDYLIKRTNKSMKCGIAWDFFDKAIDLDITIVALDTYSLEMDAAYYNQTCILNNSIIHSGDNKTGIGDGDDEQVTIKLDKLPQQCYSIWFIINAFAGGTFKDVETAKFTLYDSNSNEMYSYQICMAAAGYNSTALLLGTLYRHQNEQDWKYKKIEQSGNGLNFVESKYIMINNLNKIYDDDTIMERPCDRTIKYDLKKSDQYIIDPNISKITVGLGWDPAVSSSSIDVDGSVIIYTKIGNGLKEKCIVYYGKLNDTFGGNCVQHHGDNLTGDGDGDDEEIDIFLNELNKQKDIDTLCVVINIYSGATFNQINNCFARLVDDRNNELCKYTLSGSYNTQGMVMCSISKKKNGCWGMIAHGIGCSGKQAKDSAFQCKQICMGLKSHSLNSHKSSIVATSHIDTLLFCVII